MKRIKELLLLVSILLLLTTCSGEVPNPIIGTYSLEVDGTLSHMASIALKADGTYIFVQIIPGTAETLRFDGTYDYVLRAFNFTSADGTLYLRLSSSDIPSEIKNPFLKAGSNAFFYSWKCDKNDGPQSLTLSENPNDSNATYEFVYAGGPTALDNYKQTYKAEGTEGATEETTEGNAE